MSVVGNLAWVGKRMDRAREEENRRHKAYLDQRVAISSLDIDWHKVNLESFA